MFAKDTNLLPVTAGGLLIPVPLSSTSSPPVGFITGVPAKFSGGFVEADYLVLPWIMLIGRWDTVHSSADLLNGLLLAPNTPYFGPLNSVRNRYSPAIQFLIHSNIKASFEYQIRPKQIVAVLVDPVTGALYPLNPFRTNTAVFGLEFVY
jgi:hypothetical protein